MLHEQAYIYIYRPEKKTPTLPQCATGPQATIPDRSITPYFMDTTSEQETRAVAGKPRDAAANYVTQCLGTIDTSAASVACS